MDKASLSASLAGTSALAIGRGESVRTTSRGGLIMADRDGFNQIINHFTPDQTRVGYRYRRGFEARASDLQASTITDGGGRGHDNNQFVANRFQRAADAAFSTRCDTEVRLRCTDDHPSAAQMLQWVVGNGGALRSFGPGGRAYERNREALSAALSVAIAVELEMAAEARAKLARR